jgi:hypothetical protein
MGALCANETGVRMALGAPPRDIWNLVLGRGSRLAICPRAVPRV